MSSALAINSTRSLYSNDNSWKKSPIIVGTVILLSFIISTSSMVKLGGTGGSGTRGVVDILERMGIYMVKCNMVAFPSFGIRPHIF